MFGKSIYDYVVFQKPFLVLLAAVWLLRLVLSTAGVPVPFAQFASLTGVLVLGALYYGWAVSRRGFGSFKEIYVLNLIQSLFSQTLVALAILLGNLTGQDNIYTIPEFYPPAQGIDLFGLPPDGKTLGHAIEHIVVAGAIGFPIIGWVLGSIVHLALRPRKAAAA